jgi:transposase
LRRRRCPWFHLGLRAVRGACAEWVCFGAEWVRTRCAWRSFVGDHAYAYAYAHAHVHDDDCV